MTSIHNDNGVLHKKDQRMSEVKKNLTIFEKMKKKMTDDNHLKRKGKEISSP